MGEAIVIGADTRATDPHNRLKSFGPIAQRKTGLHRLFAVFAGIGTTQFERERENTNERPHLARALACAARGHLA